MNYNKLINKIKKKLNTYNVQELIEFDRKLVSTYKYFFKDSDVIKLVKRFEKKRNTPEMKLYFEIEKIIDNEIPPYSDDVFKRNINLIKIAIQELINEKYNLPEIKRL